MLLFTRTMTLRASLQDVFSWATRTVEYVREHSDFDPVASTVTVGAPRGTLTTGGFVDSFAKLTEIQTALLADQAYLAVADEALPWLQGPIEDDVVDLVHTSGPQYQRTGLGAVFYAVTATVAGGHMASAMSWSTDIADAYSGVTGAPVLFGPSIGGPFGRVVWVAAYRDAAAYDTARQALATDAGYVKQLDQGGELFVPGSAHHMVGRRIV